jgi:PadR family transcriptional regulator PadR
MRVTPESGGARAHSGHGHEAGPSEISSFTLHEFFVLGTLKEREMYGLEIVRALSGQPDFGGHAGMGTVYPILKTLVKEGALCSRRANGTPRVYYSLTDQGRERLLAIAKRWAHLNNTVQSVVADIDLPPAV